MVYKIQRIVELCVSAFLGSSSTIFWQEVSYTCTLLESWFKTAW